jgi:hypothetical protein
MEEWLGALKNSISQLRKAANNNESDAAFIADEIKKLKDLLDEGAITKAEYGKLKSKLI